MTSCVTVHLVNTDADLLHAQQVDETRMLTRLTLDLTSLMVALGDSCCEVTIGRNHDKSNIRLRSTCDHILDEVAMSWSIDHLHSR